MFGEEQAKAIEELKQ
ncbi:hypothetical protein S40288_10447 [Stachybotrys chartarum IBT 40288]|nr:hypothetical protein S40288_10447 [Stachybotrys chartarum IBT 40288]